VAAADLLLVVIDVGMGQSVLLVDDDHGMLIDTGLARYIPLVLERMRFHGVRELDYLVLTHLHPDHAAGYFGLRKVWSNTPVFDNCHDLEGIESSARELILKIDAALKQDPLRSCLLAGDSLKWRGHLLQVLWPEATEGKDLNNNSLVLLFSSSKGGHLLIMGDAGKEVEKKMAAAMPSSLAGKDISCFVAGHHAAEDSTDSGFLGRIRPQFSVVSVGRENMYGYPSDRSMAILERYSETVLRTDKDGEICFELRGEQCVLCGKEIGSDENLQ
jgi:competence protein ComEC